jgi:hypothetical protein
MHFNFAFRPLNGYEKIFETFNEVYEPVDFIFSGDDRYNNKKLRHKRERICRFCKKRYGETRFREDAHLIPESIGNKDLFSDFECDYCNRFFGLQFENELAPFLGISRTLTGSKTKNGIPTFKSPGQKVKARAAFIQGSDTIIISREDPNDDSIIVNRLTGESRVRVQKNPFVPQKVYKSFLKMALSLLPGEEVKQNYDLAVKLLMENIPNIKTGCYLWWYAMPFNFNLPPHALVFKKRNKEQRFHTHVVALYFQNYIFCIPVLFNKDDIFFYQDNPLHFKQCPPLFTQLTNTTGLGLTEMSYDFSSAEKEDKLVEEIVVQMNPEQLNESAVYDATTDQIKKMEFNPGNIMQIVIRRDRGSIDPTTMYEAIRSMDN